MAEPLRPLITEEDTEATVKERYREEVQTSKKLQGQVGIMKRKLETAQKEREATLTALTKAQGVRTKLEAVCRQLQKQNRAIEEESLERVKEDEEQRADLTAKFHHTIEDVTRRMEDHTGDRDVLHRDRDLLKERIANLEEQLTLRDQHYAQQLKTKDLQQQLLATRLRQQTEIIAQEALRRQKLRERLLSQATAEDQLRQQLELYGSKFEQFHGTLEASNAAFANFARDLTRMGDRHRTAVATNRRLTRKAVAASEALGELQKEAGEWQARAKHADTLNQKLGSLAAVLQKEVDSLTQELGDAASPDPPSLPPPAGADSDAPA